MKGLDFYTIENSDTPEKHDHTERKLEHVGDKNMEENEALREAQKNLLNNETLYRKNLLGIMKKLDHQGMFAVNFAEIENIFLRYCQDLSDSDIELLVEKFNHGFKKYVQANKTSLNLNQIRLEKILSMDSLTYEMTSNGIINVVHFLNARKKLLASDPSQKHSFFFEDTLDAEHEIDLIELIYNDVSDQTRIDTMSLIQIKSSDVSTEQQDKITDAHKRWISSSVMDLATFEKQFADGIPDNLTIENLSKNTEEVETLLLDMCTDPEGFNPEVFISKLDLGELSNKQKAWLILKYGNILKEKVIQAVKNEILTEEQARAITEAMDNLENKVRSKAKMPKNLSTIKNIDSIIAVGPKIIRQERISDASVEERRKKIVKVV